MEPNEERELLEAIHAAREMQAGVEEAVRGYPAEGRPLAEQMRAAAQRTVTNLELALEALRRDRRRAN